MSQPPSGRGGDATSKAELLANEQFSSSYLPTGFCRRQATSTFELTTSDGFPGLCFGWLQPWQGRRTCVLIDSSAPATRDLTTSQHVAMLASRSPGVDEIPASLRLTMLLSR